MPGFELGEKAPLIKCLLPVYHA